MADPVNFNDSAFEHVLLPLVKAWQTQLTGARDQKKKEFGKDADWAQRLFEGKRVDESYQPKLDEFREAGINPPSIILEVNKIAEAMQLMVPAMYVQNPKALISPTKRPIMGPESIGVQDPQMLMEYQQFSQQQQYQNQILTDAADVFQRVINYSQNELDKEAEAKLWLHDALLKGMGILVTEIHQPPGFQYAMVGSFRKSINDLLIDPNAEEWSGVKWIAIRYLEPSWQIEEERGYPPGVLKKYCTHDSSTTRGERSRNKERRYKGRKHDLLEYWKVFSKMGSGEKFTDNKDVEGLDQFFGKYCYWEIAKGVPYPLNMPSWELGGPMKLPPEVLFHKAQWPIPFYFSENGWPFVPLYFHPHTERVWPIGHFKFAKGELEYLNWSASFMATKTATACNTILAHVKDASDDIKNALENGRGGYSRVELPQVIGKRIQDVISILDPPPFNPELHNSHNRFEMNADKRIGLSQHIYGMESQKQMRSRGEADYREQHATTRQTAFAKDTDKALSKVIAQESFAMRWALQPKDVAPIVGPLGGMVWQRLITETDPEVVVREFDFRIEAGSSRRPNLDKLQDQANEIMQIVMPFAKGVYEAWGDPSLMNALWSFWGKAMEYEHIGEFMLPDMRQQMQQQMIDQQLEEQRRKEEEHRQELRHTQEDQAVDLRNRLAESRVKQQIMSEEAEAKGNGEA